jgi:hypothetical protein
MDCGKWLHILDALGDYECDACSGTGWEGDCGAGPAAFGWSTGCDGHYGRCATHDPSLDGYTMACRRCYGGGGR